MKQWQAAVIPLSLTSLMYAGSFCLKSLLLMESWKEHLNEDGGLSFDCVKHLLQNFIDWMSSAASNVLAWRNYVVVSFFIILDCWHSRGNTVGMILSYGRAFMLVCMCE